MCSNTLDPGGAWVFCRLHNRHVRCIIFRVGPAWRSIQGASRKKNCFLMWVCSGCGGTLSCSDWYKLLFCFRSILHVILKAMLHTAHRRSLLPEAAVAEDTSRAAVQCTSSLLIPCAHGKLNVKHHRTTPEPEILITVEKADAEPARK